MEYTKEAAERDFLRNAIVRHREAVLAAQDDADLRQADRILWMLVGDLARGELV